MRQQYQGVQLGRRRRQRRRRKVTLTLLAALLAVGLWQVGGAGVSALAREAFGPGWGRPSPTPTALDPRMAERFAQAEAAAEAAGVTLTLTSGWRSAQEQQAIVDESVATYGSAEEARRWVLPPERSAHVAGLAIDVGPEEGARWLEVRSAEFGLCRTYENEWWHFELMPDDGSCPQRLPDSSWGW